MGTRTIQPTPRVLGALASPLRLDILVVLESAAPLSAADLGRRIGRRPDTLYHHLKQLERAGLVRREARPSTGGRPADAWRLTQSPLRVRAADSRKVDLEHAGRVVGVLTRSALRDYRAALARSRAEGGPQPWGMRALVWLDAAEFAALKQELWDLLLRLRRREPREGRTPHSISSFLSAGRPLPPEPPQKGRPRKRGARSAR